MKNALTYFIIIVVAVLSIYAILNAGSTLMPVDAPITPAQPRHSSSLLDHLVQPLSLLLLQIIAITVAARALGWFFRKLGQPAVIGEMLAGILLGPSLLGWLTPQISAFVFPPASLGTLQMISQVGVILFMFLVGLELDIDSLRHQAHSATFISHAGIVFPFVLGVGLSLVIYPVIAQQGIPFSAFALFMGVAMSITAFPVLARIIEQRGLSGTKLGNLVIACAAVDDVTAWCLLAVVVSIVQASGPLESVLTVGLAIAFTAVMLFGVRPWLRRWTENAAGKNSLPNILIFVFAAALFTEAIGIHALFGAFLAGVVLHPPKTLMTTITENLRPFTAFLLPLFFAFTGLRTQIGLLGDGQGWLLCAAIIAVAIVGKLGGASVAARVSGLSWHESLSIGALMNTRGLMELIVINIGYDLGILSAQVFAMMVLMALTTTIMTGPVLSLLNRWHPRVGTEAMETESVS